MIELWIIWMFFGHVVADYFLQPEWMAINKKSNASICNAHCAIYATVVGIFVYIGGYDSITSMQLTLLFLSHYIVDGTTLLEKYMKAVRIRTWDTHIDLKDKSPIGPMQVVPVAFGSIVYVVMDNTLHLFMAFLIFQYL